MDNKIIVAYFNLCQISDMSNEERMDDSLDDDTPAPDPIQDGSMDVGMGSGRHENEGEDVEVLDDLHEEEVNDEDELFSVDYPSDMPALKKEPVLSQLRRKFMGLPDKAEKVEKKVAPVPTPPVVSVQVDNPEAVNIDKMLISYSSNALVSRLETVIDCCPPLEKEAFIALTNYLKEKTGNTWKYSELYVKYEQKPWMRSEDVPAMDAQWIEKESSALNAKLEELLHHLKKQKDEGVKESTRRAMQELLNHYSYTGQLNESLKLYNRGMRDYCTQMRHVISMHLAWLETAVNLMEWCRVDPLVSQAERALGEAEEAENTATPSGRLGRVQMDAVQCAVKNNRIILASGRTKVDAILGLSSLNRQSYRQACDRFLKVDGDLVEEQWIVSTSDIARYGSLCALATLERAEMKTKCLDSKFRKVLEAEPMLVEALSCFTRSQFTPFFQLINSIRDSLLLDPLFSSHVDPIYSLIRKRALSQYLYPYSHAKLSTMADVFKTDPITLSNYLIDLVDSGKLNARIDEREGTIEVLSEDKRNSTLRLLKETSDKMAERAEWIMLRAIVQQNKLTVVGDERPNARGKRRTNDETSVESGPPTTFRATRSNLMRMMQRGNEADSPSEGGEPAEPQ